MIRSMDLVALYVLHVVVWNSMIVAFSGQDTYYGCVIMIRTVTMISC